MANAKGVWRSNVCPTIENGGGRSDVALELGMTVNAVYLAKSRILKMLREELKGLLD